MIKSIGAFMTGVLITAYCTYRPIPEYEVNVDQNTVYIQENSTGLKYKAEHKELNEYFLKINL